MHPLIALAVAATTAVCALARPPGAMEPASPPPRPYLDPIQERARPPAPGSLGEYMLPRFLLPHFLGFEEGPRMRPPPPPPPPSQYDWLSKEIEHLNLMDFDGESENDDHDSRDRRTSGRIIGPEYEPSYLLQRVRGPYMNPTYQQPPPAAAFVREPFEKQETFANVDSTQIGDGDGDNKRVAVSAPDPDGKRISFALTPKDKGYFDNIEPMTARTNIMRSKVTAPPRYNLQSSDMEFEEPRKTRQNPISKTKTLVAENLEKIRSGMRQEEGVLGTDSPRHIHLLEGGQDPADSIYGVALIAAIGAALTVAVIGFGVGWYTLSKKAKAAADVDYPAYGVTGPTIDTSGDRRLADSAHMYHYQHQKQQIIAMERGVGVDHRNGSVSDPESEEENEEGDYTVYECPGFATTGDIEVKNPLFSDDPTPVTPAGKIELVKPQPKE